MTFAQKSPAGCKPRPPVVLQTRGSVLVGTFEDLSKLLILLIDSRILRPGVNELRGENSSQV